MSNQRLTQCPHCKASFKVSEEQLNAANGRVRCGACMNIFDAIAYSLGNQATTDFDPNQEDELDLTSDSDLVSGLTSKEAAGLENSDDLLDSEELFADNPEEDLDDPGYSGSSKSSDEFSTSFLELDDANTSDPYSTGFQEIDDEFISDDNNEAIDESWTQDILNDISKEPEERVEPSLSEASDTGPASTETHESDVDNSLLNSETDFSTAHYANTSFQYDQDKAPHSNWFVTLLFIITNLALIIALLGQAVWFHYEKLAKYPKVKEYYQLACEHIGCTLPKLENINQIKNNNLIVRSHPTQRRSLIIDTVITNEAAYAQKFPDIALYFSDINKNIVAQRLFKAHEYLAGDLAKWQEMPSNQPIHISLEIVDPGKEAVNYTLQFFSSEP